MQKQFVAVCVGLCAAGPAQGQLARLALGAGALFPTGEYSLHDKAGWHAFAAYTALGSPGRPFALRIDALYGRTSRKTTLPAGTSQVFGLDATMVLRLSGTRLVDPYLLGGVGYYELEEGNAGGGSASPMNGLALSGGAGVSVGHRSARLFLEGRLLGGPVRHGVDFIPITLGVTLGGG